MELRHKGVLYTFYYDYAPNCEEAPARITETLSGKGLDGSVHITNIYRNGRYDRQSPVSLEVLRLMEDAAAEDAIASGCPTVSDFLLQLLHRAPSRPSRRSRGTRRE
jgi:hypothetical protein